MLTCKELTELITDYLEGRMSRMERLRFQLHLGICGHCRAYLRQMRLTIRTLGISPVDSIAPGTREELLKRFRDWKR